MIHDAEHQVKVLVEARPPRLRNTWLAKWAHCVVVELASVLEQEKPPFVFADAKSFVCFADVHGQGDSFR